jgi:hypothetical protein
LIIKASEWKAAIRSEFTSLHDKGTFRMADLPLGRHAIGNKWVFKIKYNPDGSVNRFKARLVAQGFSQRLGVDYSNTFSPIVKLSTLRTFLALMAARGMHAHSFDIETTFLNADLQGEILTRQPKGVADGTSRVLRLLKSSYSASNIMPVSGTLFSTPLPPPLASSAPPPTPAYTP